VRCKGDPASKCDRLERWGNTEVMSSDGRVDGGKSWRKEDGENKERETGTLRLRKLAIIVHVRVYAL